MVDVAPRDSEAGFTLIEVLIALTILMIAVVAIVLTMGASIVASDVHRKLVTEDAIVRSYAEGLSATAYVDCATPSTAQYSAASLLPALAGPWSSYTASITQIRYWNGDNPATYASSCTADKGAQVITVEARSSTRPTVQHLDVVKRRS